MRVLLLGAIGSLAAALAGGIPAASGTPLEPQLALLGRIERAIAASSGGDPGAMQERYDAARELAESLRVAPVPLSCRALAAGLNELAASEVALTEAFDRRRPWSMGEQRSRRARQAVARERAGCVAGDRPARRPVERSLSLPGPGEVCFGRVSGGAPKAAVRAVIRVNGVRAAQVSVVDGHFSGTVDAPPGPVRVDAVLLDARGRRVGAAVSRNAWLLPRSAARRPVPVKQDPRLSARLATIGMRFDGYAALHTERLATGSVAGWNDDAPFPAASIVKLAVMIEAARRWGMGPSSPVAYDVERAAAWSSNLAANRLVVLIGAGSARRGVAAAEARLHAIGARSSTYPGQYRVGTSRTDAPRMPPLTTTRVTTARDLAVVLRAIHLAAVGDPAALRATGMRAPGARALLTALLESERVADNIGLLAPFLPAAMPVAQKNGWLSNARGTAAIVYGPAGPVILVALGYSPSGLSLARAQRLGADAVRVAVPR